MRAHGRVLLSIVSPALLAAAAAFGAEAAAAPGGKAAAAAGPIRLVRVYYFRTDTRCASCRKIEAFTEEAIRSAFAKEIESGRVAWQVVNVDEARNRHFIHDYELYTKSVVVADVVDGGQARWKNLAKIWQLLDDRPAFLRYVQDEVRLYLEGGP